MLYLIIILFALAAVLGVVILKNWLTSAETSQAVIYSHGLVAALALVILIVYTVQHPGNYLKTAIVLFVIGALVGFYMFMKDLKKQMSPMWQAFLHAVFGVAGFLVLLIFVFGK